MKLKKFFSIFLATIMLITAIPLSAYADDIPTIFQTDYIQVLLLLHQIKFLLVLLQVQIQKHTIILHYMI